MAAGERCWDVWVDTGGTFTDCVARDPDGGVRRVKVLSSSRLRGRMGALAGRRLELPLAADLGADLLRGYALRPLGGGLPAVPVEASDPRSASVLLAAAPAWPAPAGEPCELVSPEEAPLLATRLALGRRLDERLPRLRMRLATTRGTNALLERAGAATALVISRGFGDLLRIGNQQRPDLFALEIVRPEPLYATVIELDERLDAAGEEIRPLDLEQLERRAAAAVAAGIDSAAVALMHSYRRPERERLVAERLLAAGFRHVSCSAELAPFLGLQRRAETAVVDAYLDDVIASYSRRVGAALAGGRLHLMTSAGGLVRAAEFRAKDSLLSGPAGGVVGAAEAGRRSGLERTIAFDMGGTSTDVSRHDGDYEYRYETRVGAANLLAPALAIETVAAGGGSICAVAGGRLRVGPRSAGASPGPACYGAGGPLTLTDVNLLLGRLDGDSFQVPLVPAAAAAAAGELRGGLAGGATLDELLVGCLEVANELMAEAVRRVSIREGYDPADYTLVAFGGAGPQHACGLAELLGIERCLVPAEAGLLSAVGLGAARVERFAERQVLRPLVEVEERLPGWWQALAATAGRRLVAEGVPAAAVEIRRRLAELRLAGQDSTLVVESAGQGALADAFVAAYRRRYGYRPPARPLELVSLRQVAAAAADPAPPPRSPAGSRAAPARGRRRAWFGGRWRAAPVYERSSLEPGDEIAGPALVFEAHSATVVESGWRGSVDGAGALVLGRQGGGEGSG